MENNNSEESMNEKIHNENTDQNEFFLEEKALNKSNALISAKYKTSLNTNKILYASLLKIQEQEFYIDSKTSEFVVKMPASELAKLINSSSGGSLYNNLDAAAQQLVNTTLGYSDPVNKSFEYLAAITDAKYDSGIFEVRFNSRLEQYFYNVKSNFTPLNRLIMMSWKSVYSYRLFELLSQKCYYPKDYNGKKDGKFRIVFDIYELRLSIGVVNSNLDAVRRILNVYPPNYKKACEASPEKVYVQWGELKRNVIDKAVKEINGNEISTIKVSYTPKKKAHGEVYGIEFDVTLKSYVTDEPETKQMTIFDFDENGERILDDNVNDNTNIKELGRSDLAILFRITRQVEELGKEYGVDVNMAIALSERTGYDLDKIKKGYLIYELVKKYEIDINGAFTLCEDAKYDNDKVLEAIAVLENYEKNNVPSSYIAFLRSAIKNNYKLPYKNKKISPNTEIEQYDYDFDELERLLVVNQVKKDEPKKDDIIE